MSPPPRPLGVLLSAVARRRNVLCRGSDRLEVIVLAVALLFAPLAPVVGVTVGQQVLAMATAESAKQARDAHRTVAVLNEDATAPGYGALGGIAAYSQVVATWQAPDGRVRSGRVTAVAGMRAGQTLPLWTDADGSPVAPPDSLLEQQIGAIIVGAISGLAWLVLLASAVAFARWFLDGRRLRAWGTEWASVEGQWRRELL